jgi:hypothetical protein
MKASFSQELDQCSSVDSYENARITLAYRECWLMNIVVKIRKCTESTATMRQTRKKRITRSI